MVPRQEHVRGATILEAACAAALLGLSLGALFAMSGESIRLVRSSNQHAAAAFCLQERIEGIRTLTWNQVTNGTYLRDNALNLSPVSGDALGEFLEQITLNTYPTATTPTKLVRPKAGPPVLESSNPSLGSAKLVRVDAQISWTSTAGGTNIRQFTTVLTQGGIAR